MNMKHRRLFPTALLALLVLPALAQCQQLTVQPEPGKQVVLARADIEALQHIKVTTSASGTSATFEGVALGAVLEKAGVGFGQTMKGKRLASATTHGCSSLPVVRLWVRRIVVPALGGVSMWRTGPSVRSTTVMGRGFGVGSCGA